MERRRRLRESGLIRRVRSRGVAIADGPLVARVLPNQTDPPMNHYTVIAGKKQGGAVQRNRVKRLVREVMRHLDPALQQGLDIAVIVRGKAGDVPNYAEARIRLERMLRRGHWLTNPAAAAPAPIRDPGSPPAPAAATSAGVQPAAAAEPAR